MSLHRFEQAVRAVHDHLYANATIRTPEELQNEVAKILLALAWGRREGLLGDLSPSVSDDIKSSRGDAHEAAAAEVRHAFNLYKKSHRQYAAPTSIGLDDRSVAYARALLGPFAFQGPERDWLGDALEVFRSTAAKRLGGQFFTDQRVTDLAIRLLEYDAASHDLVDICAGTGGFLIAAYKDARHQDVRDPRISGIEVDPKLAQLGNSTLTHFGSEQAASVFTADALRSGLEWSMPLRRTIIDGTHQRLAGNPPFGIKITVKDSELLSRFQLGHTWSKSDTGRWEPTGRLAPRSPDILFMERNLQLAEPGTGRVALVTPYQILSGPKLGYVREWLLRNARLVAVVDLPDDTFQPWTGTKTSLVVYERRGVPLQQWDARDNDYPVFMAVARDIGHDRRGRPIQNEVGEIKTDLPSIAQAFTAWRHGEDPGRMHAGSFGVSAQQIVPENDLRINASFYEPTAARTRSHLAIASSEAFDVVPLRTLVKRVFCPGRFKRDYVDAPEDGVLFLGGSNITQVMTTNRKYLSKRDRHLAEMQVEEGWVLVTRSGSTGIVSSVPGPWHDLAVSEHVIRIVPDEDQLPGSYVEAYLRSELGQRLLAAGVFGSVIDEITPEYISELPVPVPTDPDVIKKIAFSQERANACRGEAMLLISEGLSLINGFHSGEVGRPRDSDPDRARVE